MNLSFVIIDDSELDCFVAEKVIKKALPEADINIFYSAEYALQAISEYDVLQDDHKIIILLDLMIPKMNGIQFMEAFENINNKLKKLCFVAALTTSMNQPDLNRLSDFHEVQKIIDKPITTETLNELIRQAKKHFNGPL